MPHTGQISWRPKPGVERLELYWRDHPGDRWRHYSQSIHKQPDLNLPGASKGWTTMQALKNLGWEFVSHEDVEGDEMHDSANV